MAAVHVRVERRGEHLDVASPFALATILADLELVATLVHAEQAPEGYAALGVLELDIDSKLLRMSRPKRRGPCCKFAVRLKRLELLRSFLSFDDWLHAVRCEFLYFVDHPRVKFWNPTALFSESTKF